MQFLADQVVQEKVRIEGAEHRVLIGEVQRQHRSRIVVRYRNSCPVCNVEMSKAFIAKGIANRMGCTSLTVRKGDAAYQYLKGFGYLDSKGDSPRVSRAPETASGLL